MKHTLLLLALCASSSVGACNAPAADIAAATATPPPAVRWEAWSDAAFARAKSERRCVILDLEAVWCHWCHVMEENTYSDPNVRRLLAQSFVALKVDQDARPDVSRRYEDFGWPATIIFDPDGREIVKRAGYIPPRDMQSLLEAVIADPTPGPSANAGAITDTAPERGEIDASLRKALDKRHLEMFDAKLGGVVGSHKYLDAPEVELDLARGFDGDNVALARARKTIDAELQLVDPAFGGVYQYSAGGTWTEPHFEKIAQRQADDLRVFATAFAAWNDERHAAAARAIVRFLVDFLRTDAGAFQTSQDADLVQGEHAGEYFALDAAARRARGVPRVDPHLYARENGWISRGLCAWYAASGDASALDLARSAMEWVRAHRALEGGGFRHDEHDAAGPYLGDTLAVGQAFLALYDLTAERAWLERAESALHFIEITFAPHAGEAGYSSTARAASGPLAVHTPNRDENADLARFANLMARATGKQEHADAAREALRFLATRDVALRALPGAMLLAALEIESDPLHVTVVGKKSDDHARLLFVAALALPAIYKRVEWYDPAEGPLPGSDVELPVLARAAAFACGPGRCSPPAYEPAEIAVRVRALAKK